jgi:tetratricopeptide (TPR) repeat protein
MKCATLICLLLPFYALGQAKIIGLVKLQNSGGQALTNAEAWAIGCAANPARFSDNKGYFELSFPAKAPGDVVRNISVSLNGYEVVNKEQLQSVGLLKVPEEQPLIVVLCRQGSYRQAAANFYQTILTGGQNELQAEKARLEKLLEAERSNHQAIQAQLTEITLQLEQLPKVAEAAADYFAAIDLDQANQIQQSAMEALNKGQIQEALNAMPEEQMDQQLASALKRKQQLETQLSETNQLIRQSIDNYIFKARLLSSSGNYEAADRLYGKAVAADPGNRALTGNYARFLQAIYRYDKALFWLERMIQSDAEAWRSAEAYNRMGDIYKATGDPDRALQAYQQSRSLYDSLHQAAPSNAFYQEHLGYAYGSLGRLFMALGQYGSARSFFEQEAELFRTLHEAYPEEADFQTGLASALENLGYWHQTQGRLDTALLLFRQMTALTEALYHQQPDQFTAQAGLAAAYERLGVLHQLQEQYDTAFLFFRKEAALFEALCRAYPHMAHLKDDLAIVHAHLGSTHLALGTLDSARHYFRLEAAQVEKRCHEAPANEALKSWLAGSCEHMGSVHQAMGQPDTALDYFTRQKVILEALCLSNPQSEALKNSLSVSYSRLGDTYMDLRRPDSARVFYNLDLQLNQRLARDNPGNFQSRMGLGTAYLRLGLFSETTDSLALALDYFSEARAVFSRAYQETGLERYRAQRDRADLWIEKVEARHLPFSKRLERLLVRADTATAYADKVHDQQQALKLLRELLNAVGGDPQLEKWMAELYGDLAHYHLFNQQFAEAEAAARKGLDLGGVQVEWIHANLAAALLYQGRYPEAKALYRRYKDQSFDAENSWAAIFLKDLTELEDAGITHPDVAKIRKMLGP